MAHILGLALPFFGLILLGYLAARIARIPLDGLAWLNIFIIYVALPSLIYNLVSQTPTSDLTSVDFVLASTFGTFLAFAAAFVLAITVGRDRIPEATVQGLSGAYGNIGYMGPGICIAVLGPEAGVPVALIFCFDNTLHFAMSPFMMAIGGQGEKKAFLHTALEVLKRIFAHPFILATIAGLLAASAEFQPPVVIQNLLNHLTNAAAPCALFAMGVTLALAPQGRLPLIIGPLVVIKLLVHPLIVYLLLSWIGDFPAIWVYSAVILASLPTATNVFVIAQQYGVWVARASSMVMVTTVISVVTVTALLYAISTGLLPPDLFPPG